MLLETDSGSLPPTLNIAVITLLLKPGNNSTLWGSYRPISLLNNDLNILIKALARHLEKLQPGMVHSDQNGFVQGQYGFDSIRRVCDTVFESSGHKDTEIFSIDAEKAFDKVEWSFRPIHFKGIRMGDIEHCIALYADDVDLFC